MMGMHSSRTPSWVIGRMAGSSKSLFRKILHVTPLSARFYRPKCFFSGLKSNSIKILRYLIRKNEMILQAVLTQGARAKQSLVRSCISFLRNNLPRREQGSRWLLHPVSLTPYSRPCYRRMFALCFPARSASGKPDCPLIRPARGHFIATEL
jgi:hypothetical protein